MPNAQPRPEPQAHPSSPPNQALRSLLTESGLTHAALARRVNAAGDALAHPLHLRYSKDSVSWWLRGRRPHPPIQELVAAVLTERLGRRVTTVDCGFLPDTQAGLEYPDDPADAVRAIGPLTTSVAATTRLDPVALVVAVWRWWHNCATPLAGAAARAQPPPARAPGTGSLRQARPSATRGTRALAGAIAHLTALRRTQPADTVSPLLARHLRAAAADPHPDDPGWCAALARLLSLGAGVARDTGMVGTAQRRLIQALRLAEAAGDHLYGVEIVRELSSLAEEAGHPREATETARTARDVLSTVAPPDMIRLHATVAKAAYVRAYGRLPVPSQRPGGGRYAEGHRSRPATPDHGHGGRGGRPTSG